MTPRPCMIGGRFLVALALATLPVFSQAEDAAPKPDSAPKQEAKPEAATPKPETKPDPTAKPDAKPEVKPVAKPETPKPDAAKPSAPAENPPKPAAAPQPAPAEPAPRALFNGTDLSGWKGDKDHWSVEDGAIVGSTTKDKPLKKGNSFLIWEGGEPENFELSVKFRFLEHANNSGIQFRSRLLPEAAPWGVGGYQYDLSWDGQLTAELTEERQRGVVASKGQKVVILPNGSRLLAEQFAKSEDLAKDMRPDDWNDAVVRCVGNRIVLALNGVKMLELVDHQSDKRALKGLIALQLHQGVPMKVMFKDILLKELPSGGLVKPEETPLAADARDLNLEGVPTRLTQGLKGKDAKTLEALRLIGPKTEAAELTATLLARLTESELDHITVVDASKEDRAQWDQDAKQLKSHWSGPFNKALNVAFKNGGHIHLPLSQADGQWRLTTLTVRSGLRSGDGRPNLALGGRASASSDEANRGNVAAGANDAEPETLWCAATGSENQWWQIDLGEERKVTGCQLDWESTAGAFHYRVDGSYDGQAWKPVVSGAKQQGAGSSKHDFNDSARYVRVTFFGCYPTGWAALREARVFGEKSVWQPSAVSPPEPLAPGGRYKKHDNNRPRPLVIAPPAPSSQEQPGTPPSDATVLFDGRDLSQWAFGTRDKGAHPEVPAKWKVENGYFQVAPGTGMIFTREKFGDAQLHIEWAAPAEVKGNGQGRGNSGVFILGHPEIQVLDSYDNDTYPDGQASGIYGFYPPLVNSSRKPGQWQMYDIVYIAPRLEQGHVVKPATFTVFMNGILVQNSVEVPGPAVERPLGLQDHGNPVRYRNIWLRRL